MAFMDLRGRLAVLEAAGELRRVTAEVDWDREIGAVARRVLEKKGPALLFETIIHTFSAIVTREPDTRVMNVGIYRGMIGKPDTTPMLLIKGGQHWGQHFVTYASRGEPMPVACVIGWDPVMPFLAGSPLPAGVSEWDVMGAYRDAPAEFVRCETVDREVPAKVPCRARSARTA